jgi:hypothetical protein
MLSSRRAPRSRTLLAEFLVVMMGVLAALGLEQLVVDWQERQRARATVLAMEEEFSDFVVVFQIRSQVSECIARKLDALDAALANETGSHGLSGIGRAPYFFSSRGGWNADGAYLLARHSGPAEARLYAEIYQGMEEFARLAREEQVYWAQLSTIEGHAGPFEPMHRWRTAEAVAGARNANLLLTAIADQMHSRIESLEVQPASALPVDVTQRPICQPLS